MVMANATEITGCTREILWNDGKFTAISPRDQGWCAPGRPCRIMPKPAEIYLMECREKHHWVKTDGDKPMATQHDGDKHRPSGKKHELPVSPTATSKDQDPGDRLGVQPGWASISGQKKQQTRQAMRETREGKAGAADMPPSRIKLTIATEHSDTLLRQPPVPQTIRGDDHPQHRRRNNRRAHIKNIANANGSGAKNRRSDVYRAHGSRDATDDAAKPGWSPAKRCPTRLRAQPGWWGDTHLIPQATRNATPINVMSAPKLAHRRIIIFSLVHHGSD